MAWFLRRPGWAEPQLRTGWRAALTPRPQAIGVHELSDALLARTKLPRRKFAPDSRPAIGALHLEENGADVSQQSRVAQPTGAGLCRRRPLTDGLFLARPVLTVAADADLQHAALRDDRPDSSVSLDEGVPHSGS